MQTIIEVENLELSEYKTMDLEVVRFYSAIEKKLTVNSETKYNPLVHPSDTHEKKIHNWYKFKEGYSPNLLEEVIKYFKLFGDIAVLDPFCGSGTTILSAYLYNDPKIRIVGTGVEVNPFIHFIAQTKMGFFKLNTEKTTSFLAHLKQTYLNKNLPDLNIPDLTTITNAFSKATLSQLLHLKAIIKDHFPKNEYEHDFLMLAFASILEPISCMRKSGRALKVTKAIQDYDVKDFFVQKVESMLEDISTIQCNNISNSTEYSVINNDIRNVQFNNTESYNLIVFSPPYLNHFDYTEVYKIELWMLDFVSTYKNFQAIRFNTFRSHPSVKFEQTELFKEYRSIIIREFIEYLNASENQQEFFITIKGYIDDMYTTLQKLYDVSSKNACLACIVGNSLFGSIKKANLTPVATDLLIAEIAKDIGFKEINIKIARKLTRRGIKFPYGRESIIYFKKLE